MLIFLYRLFFLPIFIILFPFYLRRMLRRGGYGDSFWQRFGLFLDLPNKTPGRKRIWVQAVSVGELQSIGAILDGLLSAGYEIVLTTTTSTGLALAKKIYANKLLHIGPFPLDFWLFSKRTWDKINPDRVLHVDSELWPEHLYQGASRQIPVDLCNARLSDRSFVRYQRLLRVSKWLLAKIRILLAISPIDRDRFLALGANPERTFSEGNLKFDQFLPLRLSAEQKLAELRKLGFSDKPCLVLLGSSTWNGEESFLAEVLKEAKNRGICVRLLLVPRHPERKLEIEVALKKAGLVYHFRSNGNIAPEGTQVYVADTIGELNFLTALADLVFIGKSLPPHEGGQSPIAAAGFGLPMVMGPNMSNFRALVELLESYGAVEKVQSASQAKDCILNLLINSNLRIDMGRKAQACYDDNQGAAQRVLKHLLSY